MKTKLTTSEDKQLEALRTAGESFAQALGLTRSTSFTDLAFVSLGVLVAQREEHAEAMAEARAYSRQSRWLRISVYLLGLAEITLWLSHR
jgi:hypothetical protein